MPIFKTLNRHAHRHLIPSLAILFFALAAPATLRAADIVAGDVTSVLGPTFFVDDVTSGGGDLDISHNTTASFIRLFNGLLTPNQGSTRVVLTGFGFFAHPDVPSNDATTITVTFTYLGADQAVGGGDDVAIGTATGNYVFTTGTEYVFAFDDPLSADLTITGTKFRIQIAPIAPTSGVALKIKTAALISEPAVNGAKLSVAGFASSLINPGRLNLAKFQAVTASSVTSQYRASYLTDGVTGNDNRWQSGNTAWNTARIDFPFPVEVGSAQVFTGVDDTNPTTNYSIQYLNGATWTAISGASANPNTNVERNLVFTNPITATSFRIIGQDAPLNIRELALFPPNGPAGFPLGTDLTINLAHQRPADASSNSAGNFALNAVDGRSDGTFWQTTTAGTNTLDIDLRVSTKIGSAHLYSGSTGVSPLANFTLKYWDGSAWQNITGGGVTGNITADRIVSFTPVITTMVRLQFTNPGTTSVRELAIFPANTDNTGYPIHTSMSDSGPAGNYETYNDSFYRITNPSSSRYITVPSSNQPSLHQSGLTTAQGQYQVLLNLSTGTYRLRNRDTGNCLSGAQLSKTAGLPLTDAPYTALPHQDWILDPLGSGVFRLINQWSGLAIDTQSSATTAGTPLVQNTASTSSLTQRWSFTNKVGYPKKGIGGTFYALATDADWTYNWGRTNTNPIPGNSYYCPMQWGSYSWDIGSAQGPLFQEYPTWRKRSNAVHLLGFNEPDAFSQSGDSLDPIATGEGDFSITRSVNEAVRLWPRLQSLDLPLVSPSPANTTNNWFTSFFSQAASLGYRVDYTAVHTYPSPNGGSSDDLVNFVEGVYNDWDRPVWLTEFSFVDWNGNANWTEEDNYNCLAEFLWRAESLTKLRKYALFVFTEDSTWPAPAQPWSAVGPRSNTYDINGNLTAFGKLYAAWDSDANIRADKTYHVHNKNTRKRLANPTSGGLNARTIRVDDSSVKWTLASAPTSGRYYVISTRDGRLLSSAAGADPTLVAAGTTGANVEWTLTSAQHGWYYLGHPASGKRLQLNHTNSSTSPVSDYSLVAGTTTTDAVQWRFIVPVPSPIWTGATSSSWANSNAWFLEKSPVTGDLVTFNDKSTANLTTTLDQNHNLSGILFQNPSASVSIGGTQTLTLGANGIDLSTATQNLTITAPTILSAAQTWNVNAGRSLAVDGGVTGAFALTVSGAGTTSLGGTIDPTTPLTIATGSTLKTTASSALPSGATALNPALNGTLDLSGTTQSINFLSGSGVITNSAVGGASLTLGNNNTGGTLNVSLQNSGGPLTFVKTGSGSVTLTGTCTHTGSTHISAGNLTVPSNLIATSPAIAIGDSATLQSTGGFTLSPNQSVTGIGATGFVTTTSSTGLITTSGTTINSAGTLTLTRLSILGIGNQITSGDIRSGGSASTQRGLLVGNGNTGVLTITGGSLTSNGGSTNIDLIGNNATNGDGTLHVNGGSYINTLNNGTLSLGNGTNGGAGTLTLTSGSATIHKLQFNTTNSGAKSSATVNLDGGVITVSNITVTSGLTKQLNFNGGQFIAAANLPAFSGLTLNVKNGGAKIDTNGFSMSLGDPLLNFGGTSNGGLTKSGVGTLTLSGANTYAGSTIISAGTLAMGASNVLPDGTAISIGTATLDAATYTDTAGTLDPTSTATIHLGPGAALAFANSSGILWTGGTLNITGTFVSGSSIRFGNSAASLTSTQLALITVNSIPGTYTLNSAGYLIAPVSDPYDIWKTQITNGLTGRTQDADFDGFTNLQEFLFGTSPIAGNGSLVSTTPGSGNFVLRWLQRETASTYTLKQSATLAAGSWTNVASPVPAPDPDQSGTPADYDRYTVTLPTSGGAWFFRIQAVEN